jgi:hypothetical protein
MTANELILTDAAAAQSERTAEIMRRSTTPFSSTIPPLSAS